MSIEVKLSNIWSFYVFNRKVNSSELTYFSSFSLGDTLPMVLYDFPFIVHRRYSQHDSFIHLIARLSAGVTRLHMSIKIAIRNVFSRQLPCLTPSESCFEVAFKTYIITWVSLTGSLQSKLFKNQFLVTFLRLIFNFFPINSNSHESKVHSNRSKAFYSFIIFVSWKLCLLLNQLIQFLRLFLSLKNIN